MKLYDEVTLTEDFTENNLCRGDIATLIDFVDHPTGGTQGAILEVFNAIGESIAVVTVPITAIAPLSGEYILTARPLLTPA